MYNKIQYLIDVGKYEKALEKTAQLLEDNNEDVQGWIFRARIYTEMGNDKEAIRAIKKCEELDSEYPFIPLLWSQFYIMKTVKDEELKNNFYFEEALKYADKSLNLDREFFDALFTKAQLLFWLGDEKYKDIVEHCHKIDKKRAERFMKHFWIDEIPKTHPLAVINDGFAKTEEFMKKCLFEEAQNEIKKMIPIKMEKKMREVLYSMRIECLICLKKYGEAEEETEKLIEYSPNYPMAYFHKAVIYWKLEKENEAMRWINTTIQCAEKENMRHPQFYSLKAGLLKKQGDKSYMEYEQFAEKIQKENKRMLKKLQKSLEKE